MWGYYANVWDKYEKSSTIITVIHCPQQNILIPNCYCVSDRLGWKTVLASQQLKDLEATPLDDPRPRHFVISSSRAHVTSSTAPWPGKPALTRPVIIQINYQSVDCLNLLEQCRSDMRQQFVSFHVQRFFINCISKCIKIWLLSDNLKMIFQDLFTCCCPRIITTKLFLPHSRIKASPHHMLDATTIDVKIHFWFRR